MTGPAEEAEAYSPGWLALREPADAAARSRELAAAAGAALADAPRPLVVHDLGSGTGSMARWLAPLLPGPQRWVLHDRDPALLDLAVRSAPERTADGSPVTVEPRVGDLGGLAARDLAGAGLVTASALLDVLTAAEVGTVAAACAAVRVPVLLTLTVVGRVALDPPDAADGAVARAFNAHQRRTATGRGLLGPDAVAAATGAWRRHGHDVRERASPWVLGPDDAALAAPWLTGWARAAAEQDPDAVPPGYLARRLDDVRAGRLTVTVGHADLLALPA